MQSVAYFSILLALASLALASSQPAGEQIVGPAGQNGSPVQVESVQVVPQQAPPPQQQQQQSVVVANQPSQVQVVHHAPQQIGGQEQGGIPVEHHQHEQHQIQHQQPQHFQGAAASYYSQAPAGLIQVVGAEQQQQQQGVVNKPGQQVGVMRSVEQYGQPESAALPPNYKPFGSWGLYIGGNPADGYYTNYYKQLGSSVEKAQSGNIEQQQPGIVKQTSALSPMLKQASGLSPFAGGDYYPFAYSMNDLSTVSRSAYSPPAVGAVEQQGSVGGPVVHHGIVSPMQAGAQVYGSPVPMAESNSQHYGVSSYYAPVESYAATKKLGSIYQPQQQQLQVKETSKAAEMPFVQQQQQPQQSTKGYLAQSRVYVYPPQQVGPLSGPVAFGPSGAVQQPHQQHQQQVVAYPVPVASQIVGSQAGVDGAFAPYGVHAFTRYAVKPTVVSGAQSAAENTYHYGVSSQLPAAYKQQQQHQQQHSQTYYSQGAPNSHYYPMSYYGYPLSQLHYSQGSIVPAVHNGVGESAIYHSPASSVVVGGSQVEASEKSETSSSSSQRGEAAGQPQAATRLIESGT